VVYCQVRVVRGGSILSPKMDKVGRRFKNEIATMVCIGRSVGMYLR